MVSQAVQFRFTLSFNNCVILISKRPRLPWHEHPSRTAVLVGPCAYGLIQAVDPARCELLHHVGVPYIQHLTNFPEVIRKGWALV